MFYCVVVILDLFDHKDLYNDRSVFLTLFTSHLSISSSKPGENSGCNEVDIDSLFNKSSINRKGEIDEYQSDSRTDGSEDILDVDHNVKVAFINTIHLQLRLKSNFPRLL